MIAVRHDGVDVLLRDVGNASLGGASGHGRSRAIRTRVYVASIRIPVGIAGCSRFRGSSRYCADSLTDACLSVYDLNSDGGLIFPERQSRQGDDSDRIDASHMTSTMHSSAGLKPMADNGGNSGDGLLVVSELKRQITF